MTRRADQFEDDGAVTLHDQICARFRALITDGRMAPGSRAPSLRALSVELGVARGTVEAAYDRLIGEGYLTTRANTGTFVANPLPLPLPLPAAKAARRDDRPTPQPVPPGLDDFDDCHAGADTPMRLQMGLPALDAFPRKAWARLLSHHAKRMSSLMKPDPFGLPRLRDALTVYLHRSRGVAAQPHQIFIVPGYAAGLALTASALLTHGECAAVEDPGYPPTSEVLKRQGVLPMPVRVDDDGLDVGAIDTAAPSARLAVVTPSHQSPTGVSLDLQRRLALLAWAERADAWIFEDDYDGEYRYQGPPLPALKSLDRQERVVYAGTFSKVLYPGLRLAYLVVPPSLVGTFEQAALATLSGGCPSLMQEVVADFMTQGHFARHLRRMRNLYARRREWLVAAIQAQARHGLSCHTHRGGMHVTITLPDGADDRQCALAARRAGISVQAMSAWRQRPEAVPAAVSAALLASFTNLHAREDAMDAVSRLVEAMGLQASRGGQRRRRNTR